MQKLITIALFGFLALACPVSAQSAAELLQKGIYTQETVGDIDAAIRIYQQVIALGSDTRTQAAQAAHHRLSGTKRAHRRRPPADAVQPKTAPAFLG
ncbi:MAG TPA: hypothetical protein VEX68_12415 [Bryobacteraceae bacterium]|nr:hypothetical protein [Bryobacteraceae bacterium]